MPVPQDPYDFANGTTADAEQVDLRFKRLYDSLNPAVQGLDSSNFAANANQSFLQLVAAGKRKVAFGTALMTFTSAGLQSAYTEVLHGLGVVPAFIFVPTLHLDSGLFGGFVEYQVAGRTPTASAFQFFITDLNGALGASSVTHGPGTLSYPWAAIG